MTSPRAVEIAGLRVVLLDGVPEFVDALAADVVVCGDPATLGVARRLLRISPRLMVLHDGGIGKDRSGVAGLDRLADVGIPAVAVRHDSARLGDANDVLTNGVIGHVNAPAMALGLLRAPLHDQLRAFGEADEGSLRSTDRRSKEQVA